MGGFGSLWDAEGHCNFWKLECQGKEMSEIVQLNCSSSECHEQGSEEEYDSHSLGAWEGKGDWSDKALQPEYKCRLRSGWESKAIQEKESD